MPDLSASDPCAPPFATRPAPWRRGAAAFLATVFAGGVLAVTPVAPNVARAVETTSAARTDGREYGPSLVANGTFSAGAAGWRTNSRRAVSVAGGGLKNSLAATMASAPARTSVLNDVSNTVVGAEQGSRYRVVARVRASSPQSSGALRVREAGARGVVTHQQAFWLTDTKWLRVQLDLTVVGDRPSLDLNVVVWDMPSNARLRVDNVKMRQLVRPTPTPELAPEPTPTPTPVETKIGACPKVGSPSSSVVAKYGTGASVRLFVPGGFKTVARPAGASMVHVSWKPVIGGAMTDAQLIAAFAYLEDGDLVEVWHESDAKYRKGADLAGMLAMKNQFHDRVVALRRSGQIADVRTVNTWAGWSVDSTSSVDPSNLHARADLLGIDMDGIPTSNNFYPYAERQTGDKFVKAYQAGGYKGWTVPEFSMPAVAVDPTHVKRIAWFQSEVARISRGVPSAGIPAPLMLAWFDDDWASTPENDTLHAANEIAAWSDMVASTR